METIENKIINSEASKAALFFGLISGGYIFLNEILTGGGDVDSIKTLPLILNWVIWLAKLVGCIWLMRFFMVKLKTNYEGVQRQDLVRFGFLIALYSTIITAACIYLATAYVFKEQFAQVLDQSLAAYSSMMDANSRSAIDSLKGSYPLIATLSQSIWCVIYGWILSAILASKICPSSGIFDDDDDDI